jgi:hypothetical protein
VELATTDVAIDEQRPKASSALSRSQNASDSLEPGRPDAGSPPQHSVSRTQSSPAGRQPLGGWQMNTPAGPGPQARLQHCEQSVPQHPPSVGFSLRGKLDEYGPRNRCRASAST